MRRCFLRLGIAVFVLASLLSGIAQGKAGKVPEFIVTGPTVLAFFTPVTESDLEKDPDLNESLSDFQFHSGVAASDFKRKGIEFHEIYAHSFSIRVGKSVSLFRTDRAGVGYYFIPHGRLPHVEFGVMTSSDIEEVAKGYFQPATHD